MAGFDELEVLRAACCVAGLDRASDERELTLIRTLAKRAGVGVVSLDAMVEEARDHPGAFDSYLEHLRMDIDETMKVLFRIAIADGQLGTEERVVLQFFADRLGMKQDRFDQILRSAERDITQ